MFGPRLAVGLAHFWASSTGLHPIPYTALAELCTLHYLRGTFTLHCLRCTVHLINNRVNVIYSTLYVLLSSSRFAHQPQRAHRL